MGDPVTVGNLTKKYGRRTAVDGVSLSVRAGQVVGFLGPNGSGKTTVMRVLVGLIAATSGQAEVMGHAVSLSSSAARAEVGYLPGTLRMPENMSGRSFLRFLSSLRGGRGAAQIELLADRFSVSLEETISSMSKGTKQKIGVIQAFMHEPSVLLLDEPTSGLDPLVQREFDSLLREHVGRGAAVLLSSHVLSEVERTADSVAILDAGHLVAAGPIAQMSSRIGRRLSFEFPASVDAEIFLQCPGVESVSAENNSVTVTVTGPETDVLAVAAARGATTVVSHEPSLDEVFVAVTGARDGR